METNAERKRKRRGNEAMPAWKVAVICLAGAAVIIGGTLLFFSLRDKYRNERYEEIVSSTLINEGVTIAGVDVSGMTAEGAKAALVGSENELSGKISFTLNSSIGTYAADRNSFDVVFNTDEVIAEALSLARDGELDELEAELEDIAQNGRAYSIDYTISDESIKEYIASVAEQADTQPTEATFTVKRLATSSDIDAQDAKNIGAVHIAATIEGATATDIDVRDYRFDFVEAENGYGVDQEVLFTTLRSAIDSRSYGPIDIPLHEIEPTVTIQYLKDNFLFLRGEAFTSYAKGNYGRASRVHNMTKSCGIQYGYVLLPGEEFSANDTLGFRNKVNGWQMAPAVIESGASTEDQYGGGVCQVNSTMYLALLKANMNIVFRQAHSSKLSYVPGGLDATIDSGHIDFKWSNNTENPVYLFTWIDTENKLIYCEIYGEKFPEEYDEIQLESDRVGSIEPTATEYVVDPSLSAPWWRFKNEAKEGTIYRSYQVFYKNGVQVGEKKEIARTTYNMHPTRYSVWPGYAGESLQSIYNADNPGALEGGVDPALEGLALPAIQ